MAGETDPAELTEVENGTSENCNDGERTPFICGVVEGFYGRPWTMEQRKDLFFKMKKFGLNTYLYAPKDDFKHRAYWRELYTVEEAEYLTSLIQTSKECGVIFYYALSPGLDIVYSNPKEMACLKRKLEQVMEFGCGAFALLFDDIEPEISETDKEIFQSFAHAQVSVTNEIYQHLSQPKFMFCPTEYCSARAVPNVQNSDYLNTIGSKLHPGIDIMWTGHKVISKVVTVQSIQELTEVLHRPPVIWDNLHANDYDHKKLFLGPYSGRSTDLIPHLRGVLSNPNCEYEANFVPIHTFMQWSKCSADCKRNANINDSVSADIKLETESENGSVEDIPLHVAPNTYHPKHALKISVHEWLLEFNKPKNAYGRTATAPFVPPPIPACPVPIINTCLASTMTTNTTPSPVETPAPLNALNEEMTQFQPLSKTLVNSLVTPPDMLETKDPLLEPMDCNPSPDGSPKPSEAQMDQVTDASAVASESKDEQLDEKVKVDDGAEEMQTEAVDGSDGIQSSSNEQSERLLTIKDVSLLCDLFYLPFEHGHQAIQILQDFNWLKSRGHMVSENRHKKDSMPDNAELSEWYDRAAKFNDMSKSVDMLLTRLTFCPNRSLVYDVYPYLWDIKGVINMLNSYVKWLALGRFPLTVPNFIPPSFTCYKESFTSGDQEPWIFLGGLTTELQKLLPLDSVNDLFLYRPPDFPSSKVYTIRPYFPADEEVVNDICRKTCDDGLDGSDVFPELPKLIGDKLVGAFLCLSPEYCFVVEDEMGICGYTLAALDANQYYKKMEVAWIPELCRKYPFPKKESGEMLTPAEEIINGFHNFKFQLPEVVYQSHPSLIRMSVLPSVVDPSIPKRLLTCVLSALKANGSHGVFCEITIGDKNVMDFYSKLGFIEITGYSCEDYIYMGRTF